MSALDHGQQGSGILFKWEGGVVQHTLSVRNKHVVTLVDGPQELLLQIRIRPLELSDVAPWFALRGVYERPAQLWRKRDLAAPDQLLHLLVPRFDVFALNGLVGYFVECAQRGHVPAPEAKVWYQPEVVVLYAAGERPQRLRGLCGEIFHREDELNVWDVGGIRRGEDGAVEGAKGCNRLLAVDIIHQEGLDDVELPSQLARATDAATRATRHVPPGRTPWREPCPWKDRNSTNPPRPPFPSDFAL